MNDTGTTAPMSHGVKPSAEDVQRLIAAELSPPPRLGYTMLLLSALSVSGVIGTLLVTESGLPLRTRAAMTVMTGVGLSWAIFAAWVLTRRRVLLAGHRVVAARMAVGFTALFTLGAWGMIRWSGTGRPWYAAVGVGLVMLAVAVAVLVRAKRRVDELSRRRSVLERQLGNDGAATR